MDVLTAELEAHGVRTWRVDGRHKHPRLCFEFDGKPIQIVMPSTPSDSRRGQLNALTTMRRIMGVRRPNR